MRLAILSSIVFTVLATTTTAVEPETLPVSTPVNHSPTVQAGERQFVVRCTFNELQATGETNTLAAPAITVREGQPATCSTLSQRPFVTGVRQPTDGDVEPVVTIVNEGSTVEVVVTPLSDTQVQIDASYQQCSICNVDEVTSPATSDNSTPPTTQAPQVCTQSSRVIRSVTLGDTIEVTCPTACCKQACENKTCCQGNTESKAGTCCKDCPCSKDGECPKDGQCCSEGACCKAGQCCKSGNCCEKSNTTVVKLTVEAVDQGEASITPIAATEEEEQDAQVYVQVYQVGDLLEDYAKAKTGEELVDADFVPVIDTVLTDALVKWGGETTIRAYPKNRGLVIAQTRQGHERISQVLSEKRDHVADVRKLILR